MEIKINVFTKQQKGNSNQVVAILKIAQQKEKFVYLNDVGAFKFTDLFTAIAKNGTVLGELTQDLFSEEVLSEIAGDAIIAANEGDEHFTKNHNIGKAPQSLLSKKIAQTTNDTEEVLHSIGITKEADQNISMKKVFGIDAERELKNKTEQVMQTEDKNKTFGPVGNITDFTNKNSEFKTIDEHGTKQSPISHFTTNMCNEIEDEETKDIKNTNDKLIYATGKLVSIHDYEKQHQKFDPNRFKLEGDGNATHAFSQNEIDNHKNLAAQNQHPYIAHAASVWQQGNWRSFWDGNNFTHSLEQMNKIINEQVALLQNEIEDIKFDEVNDYEKSDMINSMNLYQELITINQRRYNRVLKANKENLKTN